MFEMLERILAAVIVLAVVSLLIFAGKNLTGSGTTTNPTQAQQPQQQQPSGQSGGSASSRNGGQTSPGNTNTRTTRQQNGTSSGGTRTHTVAHRESPSTWWKPWTWHWRWPCPSGTRRNSQGTCSDAEDYQRQASYEERRSDRRPRRQQQYYEYETSAVSSQGRDERGYYHPEADPTGRYERDDPYLPCRDGEACSRRQLCVTNYGYFDRPCYGEGCEGRPYWQRESYRAAFGYAPYSSHQGDPVPCN